MASNVVVAYDNGRRRQTVKTTPMMPLKAIVSAVTEKQRLGPADDFCLVYGKHTLDMSLTVRFANLPPGAKLELVKRKATKGVEHVTIAVQLEDGQRFIRKVTTNTTFWDLLTQLEVESNGALNLTRRQTEASPEAKGLKKLRVGNKEQGPVAGLYLQPVCVLLDREFSTIATLRETTFASIGLTSGNAVLRVSFRQSEHMLKDILPELDNTSSSNNATITAASAPVSAPSPAATSTPEPAPTATPTPEPVPMTASTPEPTSMAASTPEPRLEPEPMEIVPTEQQVASPPSVEPVEATKTQAQKDVTESGTGFARAPQVFKAPPPNVPMVNAKIELPDSFFELTPAELKAVLAAQESRRIAEENAGFKTRAMREAEMNKRAQKYPKTMLRIRFPDRVQLQLQFLSQETVGDVYQAIKDYLRTPDRPFRLYVAPPRRDLTDKHVRLFDACLAPASVVHFVWANTETGSEQDNGYLTDDVMALAEDLPLVELEVPETIKRTESPVPSAPATPPPPPPPETSSSTTDTPVVSKQNQDSTSKSSKLPKWLKLHK